MPPSGTAAPTRRPRSRAALWALVGLLVLTLTGCSEADLDQWQRAGLPRGATDKTDMITSLWVGSWIAALGVGIFVWGLIAYAVVRFRRRRGDTGLPPQVRYNLPIEVGYTAVPLIIVLVLFFFTVRDEVEITTVANDQDLTVEVVGHQWSWDFNYLEDEVYETGTPESVPNLVLPVGEKVQFRLSSRDVNHSFYVPAFQYKLDLYPGGRVNVFEVTPTREGSYAGKCAELCGENHARMLFNVRIVDRETYDEYVEDLRERGQEGALQSEPLGRDPERSRYEDEDQPRRGSDQ